MVNRLKELFGGEPLPELPPLAMAAASRDVNKWKRSLTQEMSTRNQRMNQNLMNLSLKPASYFSRRVILLLDLSAAFDTLDHQILLSR